MAGAGGHNDIIYYAKNHIQGLSWISVLETVSLKLQNHVQHWRV